MTLNYTAHAWSSDEYGLFRIVPYGRSRVFGDVVLHTVWAHATEVVLQRELGESLDGLDHIGHQTCRVIWVV